MKLCLLIKQTVTSSSLLDRRRLRKNSGSNAGESERWHIRQLRSVHDGIFDLSCSERRRKEDRNLESGQWTRKSSLKLVSKLESLNGQDASSSTGSNAAARFERSPTSDVIHEEPYNVHRAHIARARGLRDDHDHDPHLPTPPLSCLPPHAPHALDAPPHAQNSPGSPFPRRPHTRRCLWFSPKPNQAHRCHLLRTTYPYSAWRAILLSRAKVQRRRQGICHRKLR